MYLVEKGHQTPVKIVLLYNNPYLNPTYDKGRQYSVYVFDALITEINSKDLLVGRQK